MVNLVPAQMQSGAKVFDYQNFFQDKIQAKKKTESYRQFRVVQRNTSSFPIANVIDNSNHNHCDSRPITVWCSNDYLGMSSHPKVINSTMEAVRQYGTGAGGTRNISGTSPYHCQLEAELAHIHHKEAALVFSSCYVANETTLTTLGRYIKDLVFFSDEKNHNSMIEGIRNSHAPNEN